MVDTIPLLPLRMAGASSGWAQLMNARVITTLLLVTFLLSICKSEAEPTPISLKIVAFNDFHGNLQSPGKFSREIGLFFVFVGGVVFFVVFVVVLLCLFLFL